MMNRVNRLIVGMHLEGRRLDLGELVQDNRKIYFKFYSEFLKKGLNISPFKLPLSKEILSPDTTIFDGLFGVFNDSLPDGWGRLLLDRTLLSRGIPLNEIGPMERLSFVGENGAGALVYKPTKPPSISESSSLDFDKIARETQNILKGTETDILEELFHLGGSSGGARPKIYIGYHPQNEQFIHGVSDLPEGYEHWIIKFPSSSDPIDIAEIEYCYYEMALDAGIKMNPCKLFKGASGRSYFGTKRFDRIANKKLHMHSASGLLHDNFRLSSMDYGHLMDAAFRLENHVGAYEKVLRLATFNVLMHNRDDHSKNFAFLMNQKGEWEMAPAYDLTFSFSSHGFHSTTIAGEGASPGFEHLEELAKIFGVKNFNRIFEEITAVTKKWKQYAIKNGVGKYSISLMENTLV